MAITSESLIKKLALISENIMGEAARQPALFIDAARYRVSKMRRRSQAVAELEVMRSKLALTIRAKKSASGSKLLREGAVKEKITAHSVIQRLTAEMERAYEAEEFSKLILEAYRMRRDAIRVIAEGEIAEGIRGTRELERAEQRGKILQRARTLDAQRNRLKEE